VRNRAQTITQHSLEIEYKETPARASGTPNDNKNRVAIRSTVTPMNVWDVRLKAGRFGGLPAMSVARNTRGNALTPAG
jgi:hypothetical protein